MIELITSAPVLKFFDAKRQTFVFTDSSNYAVGGWIGQEFDDGIHPCVYFSKKMNPAQLVYPTHEQELLALVSLCKKYSYLLRGVKFVARTDHQALKFLQIQEKLSYRQARWLMALQEFDFTVEYLPGKFNNVADYLSRSPAVAPKCEICARVCKTTLKATDSFVVRLRECLKSDLEYKLIMEQTPQPKGFTIESDLLYFSNRLFVPKALRVEILERFHDHPLAGHQGIKRSLGRIDKKYYWASISNDVKNYIRSCDTCQRTYENTSKKSGYSHPLQTPEGRFQQIGIDYAAMPKTSGGFDTVIVIICYLTKLVKLIPCTKGISAGETAKLIFKYWYCEGKGFPDTIVSDRDTKFTSKVWENLCKEAGIDQAMSTSRHQQTDGLAENGVKMMKRVLRKYAVNTTNPWNETLHMVEFALNSSVSSVTGFTPFYLAYGFEPREIENLGIQPTKGSLIDVLVENLKFARDSIQEHQRARTRRSDQSKVETKFAVGEWVMLFGEGINWLADYGKEKKRKFAALWLGPFRVAPWKIVEGSTQSSCLWCGGLCAKAQTF